MPSSLSGRRSLVPRFVALRTRQPGGPTQESTLGAISRFGRELIEPLTTSKASQSAEHREHDCGVA